MKYKQFIRVVLIWVSKFLLFAECDPCTIRIEDPEWNGMWYLNRINGYDMNVLPAWRSCVNGTGVTVGVVDKGIQDHIDLNIDRSLDSGFTRYSRPIYQHWSPLRLWAGFRSGSNTSNRRDQESLKHGTRVAGIVAAKKNRQGIIGIAFGAQIADVRIASTAVYETFDANLLRHRCEVIDVYSCSFSNFHTGTKIYPLLSNQKNALEYGTTYGRGGRGSVYVSATGNSGGEETDVFRDSCSYDRLVANRYVISVAGIQHNLRKLPNGEACSAIMVAAFTSKAGDRSNRRVITTDVGNRTTFHFNQNAAAVPMVSGAVALALSANPALTYRDIMHLLVQTSRSNLQDNIYKSNFLTNAAGIRVSSYFGFGLLDIGTLVERSKTWINVPQRQTCRTTKTFDSPLSRDSNYFVIEITGCSATYIEHVEISLKVNHQHAGQIKWVLESPYGTKSTILPGRGLDPTSYMDITVLTVQMWGENPNGYWKIEPTAVFGKTLDNGNVESVSLSIHGYACLGQHCLPPAEQGVGGWSGWLPWSQCTGVCGQGTKSRIRLCNDHSNSRYCPGDRSEKVSCRLPQCQFEIQSGENYSGCPSPSWLTSKCVEQCSRDNDCSGDAKCCYNGCGHSCEISRTWYRTPVNVPLSVTGNKPGQCPLHLTRRCVEQCSNDNDCLGQRKCCYNGCGHTCEAHNTWISSIGCPLPSLLRTRCVEQCSSNSECFGHAECCYNGCGHTCEIPRLYPITPTTTASTELDHPTPTTTAWTEPDRATPTLTAWTEQDRATPTQPDWTEQDQETPTPTASTEPDHSTLTASTEQDRATPTQPDWTEQDHVTPKPTASTEQDHATPTARASIELGCVDLWEDCSSYSDRDNLCNQQNLRDNCRNTCGLCFSVEN
ncbi:endoprotease bli-4-like isoform X4 [Mytilus californianus]|uniref:endoprotease bli-4-like isoform X4 n=1 Tax=Mytilus californianus TaxID=6549 RepID=UPI002245F947|nr:endoprotease bli-4-like isoform X4 [Mytilus californianus]